MCVRASYLCAWLGLLLSGGSAAYAQLGLGDGAAESGDQFGYALARGDFNGDGYQDLVVGLPYEDITNEFPLGSPAITDAGAVEVIYGTASGLASSNRQFRSQSGGGEAVPEANDFFGFSVAAGDFNGDGYDDLAIGVPGETIGCSLGCSNYAPNAGAVNVIYGSATGLSTTSIPSQFWHQDSPDIADAAEPYDAFGSSLAAGDFNGDGFADLAVGVPGETLCTSRRCIVGVSNPTSQAGAVNVIYGSPSGLSATYVPNQVYHQDSLRIPDAAETNDHFGRSLAAGDFNRDGYDDLAIGVEESLPGADFAGAVNVIYGSPFSSGLSAFYIPSQLWVQQDVSGIELPRAYDFFGWSLASGDFNGDGFDDLAVGVPGRLRCAPTTCGVDGGAIPSAGAVDVIYGSDRLGLSAITSVTTVRVFYLAGAKADDYFGWSLTAGDFNGDGYDDVAAGAYRKDTAPAFGGVVDAGGVGVIYGSDRFGLSLSHFQGWDQNSSYVEDEAEAYDFFGWSLVAGDFNHDGRSDLAVGVPLEDLAGAEGPIPDAGAVNVLYGYPILGLNAFSPPDQFWTQILILPPIVP